MYGLECVLVVAAVATAVVYLNVSRVYTYIYIYKRTNLRLETRRPEPLLFLKQLPLFEVVVGHGAGYRS
jgi:hypothetical protein